MRIRLSKKSAPLKERKHLQFEDYSDEKVRFAVKRAKELVEGRDEKILSTYGKYVYQIVEEILAVI